MTNGADVAAFEYAFAQYVGAKYAIACANGTVTLQAALVASGCGPGKTVAVPPLTMAATTIAVRNIGARPRFVDINRTSWLMQWLIEPGEYAAPVSLYGLHYPLGGTVDDAAQTLRPHNKATAFTSYSFQASKILATGEGGMLTTNHEALAAHARSYLSLGYDLRADQPRIDPAALKRPDYVRHIRLGINGRMNDVTARLGLELLQTADARKDARRLAAGFYRDVVAGIPWITTQAVPERVTHDYWTFAIAVPTPALQRTLSDAIVRHGGEMPYGAWRLSYQEPALAPFAASCPVAEALQPCLLQFPTNRLTSAAINAEALRRAIQEIHA